MEKINYSQFTILIIDDMPKNLQVLGNTLKNFRYKVEFALNGTQAIDWINKKQFDLILLDIMMPEIDGFEVCKRIRYNSNYKDIPIIFLTAKTDQENILKGFKVGGQDYITKPFDTNELMARVKTQLELRYSREKLKSTNKWLEEKVAEKTRELKIANGKLIKKNEELMILDNAKSEFLKLISHEIRTPLNGMVAPLQLIRNRTDSDNILRLIDIMDASVQRLEKFSYRALLITRLVAKRQNLKIEKIPLEELVEMSMIELQSEIIEKNILVNIEVESKLSVSGDAELLLTCLKNIIDNAVKYSDENSEIIIRAKKNDIFVKCEIINTGKGFSKKALNKIFMPFTNPEQHIDQNVGLSLYLSKLIIDAHNGEIKIENLDTGGASVSLILGNNK